jgi:hypothetical protein
MNTYICSTIQWNLPFKKEKKSKLLKMQTSSNFLPHTVVVLEILAETEDRVIKRSFKTQAS